MPRCHRPLRFIKKLHPRDKIHKTVCSKHRKMTFVFISASAVAAGQPEFLLWWQISAGT